MDRATKAPLVEQLWIDSRMASEDPLLGLEVEYRLLQLFSRDRGTKRAYLAFSVIDSSMAFHFGRQGVRVTFAVAPAHEVSLSVKDRDGRGCVASLVITDSDGRVYPPQAMRLAPDMRFHPQVYRGDGESVRLPAGTYAVRSWRGPEYLANSQALTVDGDTTLGIDLERWIDPAEFGWYGGETHIHAAGCSHYEIPTEGVAPETMIRQVRGEALCVAEVLTWGPAYYHQRQFFSGEAISPLASLENPELQAASNATWRVGATEKDAESVLRYDLEVSGFPSSHAGHLVLLDLRDQDFPGTAAIEDWPSWNLPVLKWAKEQGAITGYAHCALGMGVDSTELPNYLIPEFDSIGTNEAIIDVTHGAVDFLSGAEWLPAYELNAWYHLLNCGYRIQMVGETDYPCMSDERPGVGRSYVQLASRPAGNDGYAAWVAGLQAGRMYFGDGRSHFLRFTTQGVETGGTVELDSPGEVIVDALVAAWLAPEPTPETERIRTAPAFMEQPWHVERARIGDSRDVLVELLVNGSVRASRPILADGSPTPVSFRVEVDASSWLALRLLPSGHTAPTFVTVAGKPIRSSRRSAIWCRESVDAVWKAKAPFISDAERQAASEAFDHARRAYEAIAREALDD
jgi:hypothetical protein